MNQYDQGREDRPNTSTNSSRLTLWLIVMIVVTLACNMPTPLGRGDEGQSPEPKGEETDGGFPSATELPNTDTPMPPPSETSTPQPMDTPTLTPTITFTATSESSTVHVSGNTFCRTGPGSVYDSKGIMNTGEESEIFAKDPTGNFWYITNPDNPAERCWIWGQYATPVGPVAGLPVYTPPPTPTPTLNFTFNYEMADCGAGSCWLWFEVNNTGDLPLESHEIDVEATSAWGTGTPTKTEATETFNHFWSAVAGSTVAKAGPGVTVYTHSGKLSNPEGYSATATLTICSKDNLNGSCVTKVLNFNP